MVKAVGLWKLLAWLVPFFARQWPRLVEARAGAAFAGDRERERAAARLREHYADGYLTLDELTRRVGRVVTARSRRDLRSALAGLSASGVFDAPVHSGPRDLLGQAHRVLVVVLTGVYVVFTLTLLLALALTVLIHGLTSSELLVFFIVWVVPTYLVSRLWRRKP